MFTAALFTRAKRQKQPKSPSVGERIRNYTGILLIHQNTHTHTHTQILPFATTWIKLEDIMLSEISQDKINTYDLVYVESLSKQRKPQHGYREETVVA